VKRELLREFCVYFSSTVCINGARFLVYLWVARILGPEDWGRWQFLSLVIIYGALSHLGLINGMGRDVPCYLGQGLESRVDKIVGVAFTHSLLLMVVFAGAAYGILQWFVHRPEESALVCVLAIVFQVFVFHQFLFRSYARFFSISLLQTIFAAALVLFAPYVAWKFGVAGFIAAQIMAYLCAVLGVRSAVEIRIRPQIDWLEAKRLVRVGFPIMAVGLLYSFLTTVDRWVIVAWLEMEKLGYYSMAIMAFQLLSLPLGVVADQTFPRMARSWGETEGMRMIRRWLVYQNIVSSLIAFCLVAGAYFACPYLIRRFLPDYVPGIAPLKIVLLAPLITSIFSGYGNVMQVMNKQKYCMYAQLGALILNFCVSAGLIYLQLGINGVAAGTVVAHVFYALSIFTMAKHFMRTGGWIRKKRDMKMETV
jgi:O-antigen/teichoic acid export membrane protein